MWIANLFGRRQIEPGKAPLSALRCPLSLEITTKNPHLAQLGISSLYILKVMENSAGADACDNYQPAALRGRKKKKAVWV